MTTNRNNTHQIITDKRKLNNTQVQSQQASQFCYDKLLTPFPFTSPDGTHRTGLRIGRGERIKRCSCGHYWVSPIQRESITIWHCEKCETPRLARRQKADSELIAELLANPKLKGWDATFAREMQRRSGELGTRQREKLHGIAQKLGAKLEYNCSLSEIEGGES